LAGTRAAIETSGIDIAAIIVEPFPGNMGVIDPDPSFLPGLRALCDELGALLIFDEVISGFRVPAQQMTGVRADLTTLGKVIGGGLPVGAFGGRADLMQLVAPVGSVYQAGTLSGNPAAMAAGIATLDALTARDAYAELERRGELLEAELVDQLDLDADLRGTDIALARNGSLTTLFFLTEGNVQPRSYDDASRYDTKRFGRFHSHMLDTGYLLPPSQYEAWFLSLAHTDDDIVALAAAVANAVEASRNG
jgi:glutamate-1-semialdehyde 2,1-aminomutase